jgi:hypothetical protein
MLLMNKITEMLGYGKKDNKTVPIKKEEPKEAVYQPGLTDELLLRQAYKESTFNPKAVSPKGYKGLAQIGEDVVKDYIRKKENKKLDPFNPEDAIQLQKFAMEDLYNSSFINKPDQSDSVRIAKSLAGFNWGRGNLFDYLGEQKKKGIDIYNSYDWLKDLPKETSDYVNKIFLQKDESFNKDYQKAISNPKYKDITGLYETKEFGGDIPSAQNGEEMKFYQEGLDWKPKSMQDGGQQRGGNTLDDDIISPLMKGVGSVIDYVGNKANDALQYVTDLQKMQLYSTYPVETAKAHAKINNWLFNNVRPVEYPGILTGVKNIGMGLLNMNAPAEKNSKGLYNIGDEAWQKSLGKTEQEMQSYYIIPSKHKPSDAEDPNATYYTLKKGVIDPQLLIEEARKRNLKENESVNMTSLAPFIREGFMPRDEFSQIDPIQKFKLSKGKDEKGEYVSIYDKYDFNGPLNSLITPYEWYDRFYINKQSKLQSSKPSKKKEGGVIKDNKGYLNPDNWGKPVQINSNNITMEGVYEPLLGIDDTGDTKLMLPGENYKFKGKKVTEYPLMQKGGSVGINQLDAQPKKKLNQLLNFTNNPDKNWLDNL